MILILRTQKCCPNSTLVPRFSSNQFHLPTLPNAHLLSASLRGENLWVKWWFFLKKRSVFLWQIIDIAGIILKSYCQNWWFLLRSLFPRCQSSRTLHFGMLSALRAWFWKIFEFGEKNIHLDSANRIIFQMVVTFSTGA